MEKGYNPQQEFEDAIEEIMRDTSKQVKELIREVFG